MRYNQFLSILVLILCTYSLPNMHAQLDSKNYNMTWSIELDKYSAITHCTIDQIKTWQCKLCKKAQKLLNLTYIYNQQASILAFLGYMPSQNSIVISWRGTVDITNWIQDFTYYQIQYQYCKNCKIHFGFLGSYLIVEKQLMDAIKVLMDLYPTAQIVSTGSSLGGALATVCALQLQMKINKVRELHTFGCPRVGNAQYAQFVSDKIQNIFRVVHNRDIVPHVPLQSQNYHQYPNQILFDENMHNYIICDDSGQDPKCSNKYYPNFSIPDHVTYFYKPDLEDLCTV